MISGLDHLVVLVEDIEAGTSACESLLGCSPAWRSESEGSRAVLFTLGNYLNGLYLGQAGVASAYGAAGSLVVILVWVYYSSQVLLFGAEFTQVFACKFGREIVPADNAVPLTAQARARQGSGCRPERA